MSTAYPCFNLEAAGLAKKAGITFKHVANEGAAGAISDMLGRRIDAADVSYAKDANYMIAGFDGDMCVLFNTSIC